jgi:hypothetical protein
MLGIVFGSRYLVLDSSVFNLSFFNPKACENTKASKSVFQLAIYTQQGGTRGFDKFPKFESFVPEG